MTRMEEERNKIERNGKFFSFFFLEFVILNLYFIGNFVSLSCLCTQEILLPFNIILVKNKPKQLWDEILGYTTATGKGVVC